MSRRAFSFSALYKDCIPLDHRYDTSDFEDSKGSKGANIPNATPRKYDNEHQMHDEVDSKNVKTLYKSVTSPNISTRKHRQRNSEDYNSFLDREARKYYACHTYETTDLDKKSKGEYQLVAGLSPLKGKEQPGSSAQKLTTSLNVASLRPIKEAPLVGSPTSFRFIQKSTSHKFPTSFTVNPTPMNCFCGRAASSVGECQPVINKKLGPFGPVENPEVLMSIISYDSPTSSAKSKPRKPPPRSISSALKRRRNVVRPSSKRRWKSPRFGIHHIIKKSTFVEAEESPPSSIGRSCVTDPTSVSVENETYSSYNPTPKKKTAKNKKNAKKTSKMSNQDVMTPVQTTPTQPYIPGGTSHTLHTTGLHISQLSAFPRYIPPPKRSDDHCASLQEWNTKGSFNYRSVASAIGKETKIRAPVTSRASVRPKESVASRGMSNAMHSDMYCPECASDAIPARSFVHRSVIPRSSKCALCKKQQWPLLYSFQFKPQRMCLCRREQKRPPPRANTNAAKKSKTEGPGPTERYSYRYRFSRERPKSRYASTKAKAALVDAFGWDPEEEWEDFPLSEEELPPILPSQLRPEELKFLTRYTDYENLFSDMSSSSELSSPTDSGELICTGHTSTPLWSLRSPLEHFACNKRVLG